LTPTRCGEAAPIQRVGVNSLHLSIRCLRLWHIRARLAAGSFIRPPAVARDRNSHVTIHDSPHGNLACLARGMRFSANSAWEPPARLGTSMTLRSQRSITSPARMAAILTPGLRARRLQIRELREEDGRIAVETRSGSADEDIGGAAATRRESANQGMHQPFQQLNSGKRRK
jgi:hypothetical protein